MKRLDATFRIVTPMFLGDANQVASGFRVPSFKGALRFWWRAIVWSRMTGDSASATLRDLHDREASLFGLASGSESSTQSKVLLSAEAKLEPAVDSASVSSSIWSEDRVEGVGYLKGQGVTRRNAIPSGTVRLRIMFRSGVCDEDRRDIERALFAFGLLGGLGSRSRRGLGSCALESLEGNRALDLDPPKRKSDFKPALEEALGKLVPEPPPSRPFRARHGSISRCPVLRRSRYSVRPACASLRIARTSRATHTSPEKSRKGKIREELHLVFRSACPCPFSSRKRKRVSSLVSLLAAASGIGVPPRSSCMSTVSMMSHPRAATRSSTHSYLLHFFLEVTASRHSQVARAMGEKSVSRC